MRACGRFATTDAGYSPVACDTTGFFRPQLGGGTSKHSTGDAKVALPAVVFGGVASVGTVCGVRVPLLRPVVRGNTSKDCEADLKRRLLKQAGKTQGEKEGRVADAGFALADVLSCGVKNFVVRVAQNFTARKNVLPEYKGKGRMPGEGEKVRPLPRTRKGKTIAAHPPTTTLCWNHSGRTLRAHRFSGLTLPSDKPGRPSFECVVIFDPLYKQPLVLATNLPVSAYVLWQLYRDRWAVEQLLLAAKVMRGGERALVFHPESRFHLPELALLAGNVLSSLAADSQPLAAGFWDRAARPTCGCLRRLLFRQDFSLLPCRGEKMRKKNSVTVTVAATTGKISFTANKANAANVTIELLLQPLKNVYRKPTPNYTSAGFFLFTSGGLTTSITLTPGVYSVAIRFVNSNTGQEVDKVVLGTVNAA